jgi:hypothetical protein
MKIEVSNGEILDKYAILNIKMQNLHGVDDVKATNVRTEYETLTPKVDKIFQNCKEPNRLESLYIDLLNINKTLWNIEDQIRDCESDQNFGADFIELARSVYYTNDERSSVKKEINSITGSRLVEEKAYKEYK